MDLWIGNATRQRYEFRYKLPDIANFRVKTIEVGGQAKIEGLTREEIDYVVDKHSKYGMIPQDSIDRSRSFNGTCYAVDKPIEAVRLSYLMDHNMGELVAQGKEIRQANAVAQSMNLERALNESGRPEKVYGMDVTIQEENHDPNNEVPQLSVGTSVSHDESRPTPTAGRPRRRNA